MTQDEVVVFGAGGHGKVVADILIASGISVGGFVDDGRPVGTIVLGRPVLGPAAWLAQKRVRVALGVGDNTARARIADACLRQGLELVTAIHPSAAVSSFARLGDGVVVMALAVVNPDAVVARGAIVNTGAVIEHDCIVGEFAHISPNAGLGGGCKVGERAHLGIGASMLPGTSVGARSIIGGGAFVACDIPDGVVARGVPARVARKLP